jgi:hypothetical protein
MSDDSGRILAGDNASTITTAPMIYTTAIRTIAFETTLENSKLSSVTSTESIIITNGADYVSIIAAESSLSAASASATDSTNSTASESGSGSVLIGAILGAIGGLLVLNLIVFTTWFILRRKRRQRLRQAEEHGTDDTDDADKDGKTLGKAQLHADDIKPQHEMQGSLPSWRLLAKRQTTVVELPVDGHFRRRGELPPRSPVELESS